MLYFRDLDGDTTSVPFDTRLFKNPRRGVVSPLAGLRHDGIYIRTLDFPSRYHPNVSIVICTLDRQESLNETLQSLSMQTFKDFEIILITERGDLSVCRDKGLRAAVGDIVSFIDDDVYCPTTWLQGVTQSFREGVLGVTGPTIITPDYQKNRDCFKFKRIRQFQEWLFKVPSFPSQLSVCGAPSMASNDKACSYEGQAQYLECCNMSVRRKEALDVGGFDHSYIRTSEWCELDLSLKLSKKGKLIFSQSASLYHRPSKAGVYKARIQTNHRWKNFILFQKRWVKPSVRRLIYWGFIWTYFKMKEMRMI